MCAAPALPQQILPLYKGCTCVCMCNSCHVTARAKHFALFLPKQLLLLLLQDTQRVREKRFFGGRNSVSLRNSRSHGSCPHSHTHTYKWQPRFFRINPREISRTP